MNRYFLTILGLALSINLLAGDGNKEEVNPEHNQSLNRHKAGIYLGNSLIREVHNTHTGKEQFVLAPTFGIDYEYWISHKWAIGTYNEIALLSIEVEHDEEEYLKRENAMLFSGVVLWEAFPRFSIFAGMGVETDQHHTLWARYLGAEYAFIRNDGWDVGVSAGYINKDLYDVFTFGVVIGRRFGKEIPSRHH